MARFKKGQTVYMGRGDKMRTLVVDRVIKNPLIPIHQYTFEAPNNGFACGEQSIRSKQDGKDLKMGECFVDNNSEVATRINTIASAMRKPIMMDRLESGLEVGNLFSDCDILFRPDLKFCDWLIEYADSRLIVDVGSGQGHLVTMLKRLGGKAIGIEPNIDHKKWLGFRLAYNISTVEINEILPRRIDDPVVKNLITKLGKDKAILVFARSQHKDFVEIGINNMPIGMEALYITPEGDLNDLGRFKKYAVLIEHQGVSEDNEVVYSIIKR